MLALEGHAGQVTAVAFSPCGRWLASAGWDGAIRLWERPQYQVRRVIRTPYDHAVTAAFSADSTHLAAGFRNRDGWPHPVNVGNLAWLPVAPRPATNPEAMPYLDTWFALDGARRTAVRRVAPHPLVRDHVAVAGDDHIVRVWDAANRVVAKSYAPRLCWSVTNVRYSATGLLAWLSGPDSRSGQVFLWDGVKRPAESVPLDEENVGSMVFSPDGAKLYLGLTSGKLAEWTPGSSRRPRLASLADVPATDIAAAPDGRSLLIAGEDGIVRLWDVEAWRVRDSFNWRIGTIAAVAVAPDGLTAAAAGDGVVFVWDCDG